MSSTVEIASSFIEGAPPGELSDVVNDIKTLTSDSDPALISKLKPAFQRYNESQLTCVKLPGASQPVIISKYNRVPSSPSKYYDTALSTSFDFDHTTLKASNPQSYTHESPHSDLITSTLKALSKHFEEHYPASSSSAFTVVSSSSGSSGDEDGITLLLSTTKSSPSNFISGRWRSTFHFSPATGSLTGTIAVQVHYYEDGNVALTTAKNVEGSGSVGGGSGVEIVRKVAALEKAYQEEVNRAMVGMNEGSFKALRRQLPVTRQRVEWEKVRGYSLGGDLRGEGKR